MPEVSANFLGMDYFVIGPDGKEYGPASTDTLKQWVVENRVLPGTMLKSVQSGLTVAASTIPALFPPTPPQYANPMAPPAGNWSQPPTANYPRAGQGFTPMAHDYGKSDVIWAIVRSALALVFLFVLNYGAIITAVYAVVWAFRAREKGHRLANLSLGISIVTLIIVGVAVVFGLTPSLLSPRRSY